MTTNRLLNKHFRLVSFTVYRADLEQIDAYVAELKARGFPRMSRSAWFRLALRACDTRTITRDAFTEALAANQPPPDQLKAPFTVSAYNADVALLAVSVDAVKRAIPRASNSDFFRFLIRTFDPKRPTEAEIDRSLREMRSEVEKAA